ncbi:hypothetical protein BB560_007093 [Smittium megazygosporum]|uniref:Uncharacterized protein n=1 Tax=Smittium megazygosporum TaxID=133381 RepID=A0A2T9XYT2_9FUNG|nr:hypothetical protein BB560_007093 [Smittium megazygosporum]
MQSAKEGGNSSGPNRWAKVLPGAAPCTSHSHSTIISRNVHHCSKIFPPHHSLANPQASPPSSSVSLSKRVPLVHPRRSSAESDPVHTYPFLYL